MEDTLVTGSTKRVTDLENASDFEKKHAVSVAATKAATGYDLTIHVGATFKHPMEPAHWINWLDVRSGDGSIARFDLSYLCEPYLTCHVEVEAGTKIDVISSCNIHGLWGTTITLE